MPAAEEFDGFRWHDVPVHGFTVVEGEHVAGELWLDLDLILEWLPPKQGKNRFRMAPAWLIFHDVVDLAVSIDFAAATAAMGPFCIQEVSRNRIALPSGSTILRWSIALNWPQGEFSFLADRYTELLRAAAVEVENQRIPVALRRTLLAQGPNLGGPWSGR